MAIELGRLGWLEVLGYALLNWLLDAAVVVASLAALRVPIPWSDILVIYGLTQVSASFPLTPAGLGVVEGSLTALLHVYGVPLESALAVVILYRILSFWILVPIGWGTWAVLEVTTRHRPPPLQQPPQPVGVPIPVPSLVLDGTVYPDGSLPASEVVRRSATEKATTAGPSPGDFLEVIKGLQHDREVLVVTVSANMSSTHEAATLAAGYFSPGSVEVLDSGTAAGAQGLVTLAAAEVAARGGSLAEVTATARAVAVRVHLLAALQSLDQLARSGRVPGLAARAGDTLGVRPLFEFTNGEAHARRPALSQSAALRRMVENCLRSRRGNERLHGAILHARAEHQASELGELLSQHVTDANVFVAPFSSVMVVHTGPGLVGLAWWWEGSSVDG